MTELIRALQAHPFWSALMIVLLLSFIDNVVINICKTISNNRK